MAADQGDVEQGGQTADYAVMARSLVPLLVYCLVSSFLFYRWESGVTASTEAFFLS